MGSLRFILVVAGFAVFFSACGGGGGGGTAVVQPASQGNGGTAGVGALGPGDSATGGQGGQINLSTTGAIFIGVNPAPAPPVPPAIPTTGIVLDSATLAAHAGTGVFSQSAGNIIIPGQVTVPPSVTGDFLIRAEAGSIVVSGSLTSVNNTELSLRAVDGSIFVLGLVRTGNTDGTTDGSDGDNISLNATETVIVSGTLDSRGEPSAAANGSGGDGGHIELISDEGDVILFGGTIDATGGDATAVAGNNDGGRGGFLEIFSGMSGSIYLFGNVISNGGSAMGDDDPRGGGGGIIQLSAVEDLIADTAFDLKGGDARGSGFGAIGGSGGAVHASAGSAAPGDISLYGTIAFDGGAASAPSGAVRGGNGGSLVIPIGGGPMPHTLNLPVADWPLSGGDSNDQGGSAGLVVIVAGDDVAFNGFAELSGGDGGNNAIPRSGGVFTLFANGDADLVSGTITADGGGSAEGMAGPGGNVHITSRTSILADTEINVRGGSSADGAGGAGGFVLISSDGPPAASIVDVGGQIRANGGDAGGDGPMSEGGLGGLVVIRNDGGEIQLEGTISANGGDGTAAGPGGDGGRVAMHSDFNGTGDAGDITVAGTIDVSGGAPDGEALNNGVAGTVGVFGGLDVALELDADALNNNLGGDIVITGGITADGAAPDGAGGDIRIDGGGIDSEDDLPASFSNDGSGTGADGDIEFE